MDQNDRIISLTSSNGVGIVLLNNPPANAYQLDFMNQLIECIKIAEDNSSIRVVVIKSDLERFFCAGADIKVWAQNTTAENKQMVSAAREVTTAISQSDKIYIAAIDGHTFGGGLELAMACDLRLASEGEYAMGLTEVNIGLIPGNGGTQRLLRLAGATRALELLVTGATISPELALKFGLINHLWPADSFKQEALNYARELSHGPPMAIAAIKRSIREGIDISLEKGLELEQKLVDPLYETSDAKEGLSAFLEKRKPNFNGE